MREIGEIGSNEEAGRAIKATSGTLKEARELTSRTTSPPSRREDFALAEFYRGTGEKEGVEEPMATRRVQLECDCEEPFRRPGE